jgi:thiamine-phosphate pyrophosphorylase
MTRWLEVRVCLVTDRRRLAPDARTLRASLAALEALVDEAIEAGVDAVQVREPDLEAAVLAALVRGVAARAGGSSLVMVNDRADVAQAAGAAGAHLRADGPPVPRVRAVVPAGFLIGRSVHSVDDVRAHQAADYLLFGTVFGGGTSKGGGAPLAGLDALRAAAAASGVPVLAIGGINPARAAACAAAGAAGVAAIGAFLPPAAGGFARGAARAVRELRAAVLHGRAGAAAD